MRNIISIVFSLLLINKVFGYGFTHPIGGNAVSMGGVSTCERGLWSLQNNPAGLTAISSWDLGIHYENRWMLRETGDKSAGFGIRMERLGSIGFIVHQFGSDAYSESQFGIAYARDFGPHLQMGLRADYLLFHFGDSYPNRSSLGFEFGIQSSINEKLMLGFTLCCPLVEGQKSSNALPLVARTGIRYRFCEGLSGYCDIEKDSQHEGLGLHGGFEYELFSTIQLRAGMQMNPDVFSFGIGYMISIVHVDIAAEMHPLLGTSIQVSMNINPSQIY